MDTKNKKTAWFVTGSQHLYGREALDKVAENAGVIADHLNEKTGTSLQIEWKPVLTSDEGIFKLCQDANSDPDCVGLIMWMHTFSPAQMWIRGLEVLKKPFLHLHTQFNRDIPWSAIDMDFMNLNQSAHGDREFGFICSRMKKERAVLVGHWQDTGLQNELDDWLRAALAWNESRELKIVRFGDNMRNVAVTEGNKVSARIQFGWSVEGFGVGELAQYVDAVSSADINTLVAEYADTYKIDQDILRDDVKKEKLTDAARIEIGLLRFLEDGGYGAFTTTFEDLHGLKQLPGLSVQRLMEKGYGFGAEGDWKTAALIRCMKVMGQGLNGGTSFMEDYTYHLEPGNMTVLGAHMLEICPSIASGKPSVEVHPLSIGGKDDPARLVFTAGEGDALNASLLDMGSRFRLLVNTVKTVTPKPLPKLPVARALWNPMPNLKVAATAWILAGGAHHTGFSFSVKPVHLQHFADMAGMELLMIDENPSVQQFREIIRWNELYYQLKAR